MPFTNTIHDRIERVFSLIDNADKTEWESLLAPTTAPTSPSLYTYGTTIFDVTTGVRLSARWSTNSARWFWEPAGGAMVVKAVAGAGGVTENRFVRWSASGVVIAVSAITQQSGGIAMNTAAQGETVYVLTSGVYLVENGGVAVTINARVAPTANGRSQDAVATQVVAGFAVAVSQVIGATTYDLVAFDLGPTL